jgi:hypothetical protein
MMRTFWIMVISFVPGCSQSEPSTTGLYRDDEIRRLAGSKKIEKYNEHGQGFFGIPCLDVVPSGSSLPRSAVFEKLHIDESRIQDFREWGEDNVVFLIWQLSPSYDICCMTATNDSGNDGLAMTDPKREVYGIRLVKRGG